MDKRRNKIGLAPDKPRISNEELSEFTIINVLAIILMIFLAFDDVTFKSNHCLLYRLIYC